MEKDLPTWTILVPTLGQRGALFQRLMAGLLPQLDAYEGRVRVLAWWNNGDPSLPQVRQGLIHAASTDYVSFVDDDDLVPDYFVDETMAALATWPDYVGWQTRYSANGVDHGIVDQSLRHGGWRENKRTGQLLRDITHINPMRTDVAKRADFRRTKRPGQAEDRLWVNQVRASGLLRREVYIDKVMYEYLWRDDTSAWRKPHLIDRTPTMRPLVASPWLSWHPRSAGCPTTPQGEPVRELLIIIPTRGRPQNMQRVIEAWRATGAFEVGRLLFAVDDDDPELDAYLALTNASQEVVDAIHRGEVTEVIMPEYVITVAPRTPMAVRTNIEAARFAGQFFALGSAGDDHVPQTPGWAQRYVSELHGLGAGIVYGDDGYQRAKLCTEWAMTSNIVQALGGRLVPAPVDHLYADNSILELGKRAGVLHHLADVKITHMHPAAGRAERDEGYDRVNARERYAQDGARFKKWRQSGLAADVALVSALVPPGPPVAARSGPASPRPDRHRIQLGLGKAGVVHSRPSVRLDRSTRRRKAKMTLPRRIRAIRGLTSEDALVALADMAIVVPADQAIVELGVYQGQSALVLAWGAEQGAGAHVYGIDPWELCAEAFERPTDPRYRTWPAFNAPGARRWAEYNVKALGYGGKVTLLHGFSADVGGTWIGPPVGLLFVDGDHRYNAVCADVVAWATHLAPGATIVFDDYESSHPETIRAIDEMAAAGVLEPVQIFHGRLAVTKLAQDWNAKLHALMGGWVPAAGEQPAPATIQEELAGSATVREMNKVAQEADLMSYPVHQFDDPDYRVVVIDEAHLLPRDGVELGPAPAGRDPIIVTDEQQRAIFMGTQSGRAIVHQGELEEVPPGTDIEDLNLAQMKVLAKHRGITLGTRKDKKSETLQALRAGE